MSAVLAGLAAFALGCGGESASGTFEPATADTLTVVTEPLPIAGFWEGSDAKPTGGLEYAIAEELRSAPRRRQARGAHPAVQPDRGR